MREWLRARAVQVDEPSKVMAEVAEMAASADVMVLSEHWLWAAEMDAVLRWAHEELEMDGVGAAAVPGPGGGASAGVILLWRRGEYEREEEPSEGDVVMPGRMVSVMLKDRTQVLTWVAGVYMRNRQDPNASEDWQTLTEHVYERERLIVGGDMNAETITAMARGARPATAADRAFQGLVRDAGVVVVSDERAETYERAGTTLDYWLATAEVASEMTTGLVMPGVADHMYG